MSAYEHDVWLPKPADFLASRGLRHSTIQRFRLGYVRPDSIGPDARFADCLTLPYTDGLRRIRSIRYRPLYPSRAKYLSVKGSPPHLFAVRAVDNPRVWVCEGEIDAMTLWQMGLPAVGVPGAQLWKDEWKWLFRDCQLATVCFDPDPAGERGGIRVYQSLQSVCPVSFADLPNGIDVNALYISQGEEAVRKAVL